MDTEDFVFESSVTSSEESSDFPAPYEAQLHHLESLEYCPDSDMIDYTCQDATSSAHIGGSLESPGFEFLSAHHLRTSMVPPTPPIPTPPIPPPPILPSLEQLQYYDAYSSTNKTVALEHHMLERYSGSPYSTGNESAWSPIAISDSHDGTDPVGVKYGSRASEKLARLSEHISALQTHQTRGNSPPILPTNPRLSCQKYGYSRRMNQVAHQCPVCPQSFRRRDNIKPHVKSKHPDEFEVRYATNGSISKHSPLVCTTNHLSAEAGSPSTPCLGANDIVPTNILPQSKLQHHNLGLSEEVSNMQDRSHDSDIQKDGDDCDSSSRGSPSPPRTVGCDRGASLACPFQKRDPFRHQKCFGVWLGRIKDVKQHVYRAHSNPEYYCAACYQTFDTATERDDHSRQRGCQTLDHPSWEQSMGINEDQRKKLAAKSCRTMSEEEQWKHIWDIIFPGIEQPASAYRGDCLKELVPVMRQTWARQATTIMENTSGVYSVMDAFFRHLEGDTATNIPDVDEKYDAY